MTTAQTTDSQAVQSTSLTTQSAFTSLQSSKNPMMAVAAAFMAMMAMGANMVDYLKDMTQTGMQLTTQGENFSNCSNFDELFHTALDSSKNGQGDLMDSAILGTLDPDDKVPQGFKSMLSADIGSGKEELNIYEAYTEDPTQSGAKEAFVGGFKQEASLVNGIFIGSFQDHSTSNEGVAAYNSAYTLTQSEEDLGKKILQMVQSFISGFSSQAGALAGIAESK